MIMNAVFSNPFTDGSRSWKSSEPCVLVIFGATGDLTSRKLLPALYNLAAEGELPAHFACVGFARREKSNDQFRNEMLKAINDFSRVKPVDPVLWEGFSEGLFYHQSEFDHDEGYIALRKFLLSLDEKLGTKGNRLFYLSTQPSYFSTVVEKLGQHNLLYSPNDPKGRWSRVIIEKPFGHDLNSAIKLQSQMTKHLDESQIYRIDHYLGKETVQNLLVFRFSNPIFEAIWNNRYIDHVQITVSEEIGIGTRGHFWEEAGLLRDIIQNHVMQLLSLVAMEPPSGMNSHAIHDEKVKVMESLRPFPQNEINKSVIRGQYSSGYIDGKIVKGYREEDNVNPNSFVETYSAMEIFIDNWRWAGVPFYIRAGKRLPKRATEIAITFKDAPGFLFKDQVSKIDPNILVIRIQPDEGISLKMNCKVPGHSSHIQPVKMDFRYGTYFGSTPPEAYERLICDAMSGDSTLFARVDELLASWRLFTPVLYSWQYNEPHKFPNYSAGTWGPQEADVLIARGGRKWRLL